MKGKITLAISPLGACPLEDLLGEVANVGVKVE